MTNVRLPMTLSINSIAAAFVAGPAIIAWWAMNNLEVLQSAELMLLPVTIL